MGSFWRLPEIAQVRRRLILPGRHQIALGAPVVSILADTNPGIARRTGFRAPDRSRIAVADRLLEIRERPGESVIEDRDLVIDRVAVGLVEMNAFLDHALVVAGER